MVKNTKGSSMVSVMVAFIILLMGIAMLYGTVQTSRNLAAKAEENLTKIDTAVNSYYIGALNVKDSSEGMQSVTLAGEEGPHFSVNLGAESKGEGYWFCYFTHKKEIETP